MQGPIVRVDSAEPSVSVIVTGHGSVAERQSLGKELLDRARESGYSAEVLVVDTPSPPTVEGGVARAVGAARGAFVAFVDPASGFSPETLPALVAPLKDGTHDLVIAVRDGGLHGAGSATVVSRIKSRLARLIFWPVAQTRDPWSGWYALRRDQLVRPGRPERTFPMDLPAVLLTAGPDLRIAEVSARAGFDAPAPALREVLARLQSGMIAPAQVELAGAQRWFAGTIGIAIDLVTTLALLALGWTLGASNIAGFIAGAVGYLAARALRSPDTRAIYATRRPSAAQIGWHLVVAALALGLRGGAVATALAYGLPGWMAVIAGVGVGWSASAAGNAFHTHPPPEPGPPAALRWSIAAVGILGSVFLLHLFYLKVLPLTPEEAYYWNYSIRPDFGYLDHPPMVAWLIALVETLFGHGEASIRIVSLACGVVVIAFVYRLARRLVDRPAALLAAALAASIPYTFFSAGLMTTPDAPLAAAWAASLYFLHRALVGGDGRAWYGVGIALGLGLLSKYTIATLGPAALAFCILDRRARGWFLRPEPYLAVLIAVILFAPVVYWNYANDWASFRFQGGERFGDETQFSLHHMLMNILLVATPLPVAVLPLLFVSHWTEHPGRFPEPAHAHARNRLFVGCFVLVPLAVFAWSALRHLPRLNWTGPIWLATLPLLGWAIVRADALRRFGLGTAMRLTAGRVVSGLLVLYAAFSYYVVLGIPGVPYPQSFSKAVGWPEATRELQAIHDRLARETGVAPVIVGMDKYNIASQVSFFAAREYAAAGQVPLKATTIEALSSDALMFTYWDPPEQFRGRTLVMVTRRREALATERLAPHFRELDAAIHPLPLVSSGHGGNGRRIADAFYRIGYEYRPPPRDR
jgi:dolichol-phosphate mannosyltransferase